MLPLGCDFTLVIPLTVQDTVSGIGNSVPGTSTQVYTYRPNVNLDQGFEQLKGGTKVPLPLSMRNFSGLGKLCIENGVLVSGCGIVSVVTDLSDAVYSIVMQGNGETGTFIGGAWYAPSMGDCFAPIGEEPFFWFGVNSGTNTPSPPANMFVTFRTPLPPKYPPYR